VGGGKQIWNDTDEEKRIYRIIDANLNRLREGLRVCEECFRFAKNEKEPSQALKALRHRCKDMQKEFDKEKLFSSRDSAGDIFADGFEAGERRRETIDELFCANIKRCQEAARVVEEFAKLCRKESASRTAKNIRFNLYSFEKDYTNRITIT
jgi:thiamine-phosphate pyrophosphorylase